MRNKSAKLAKSARRCLARRVDAAIGSLLMELVTPMNLEVTLAVQRELESRAAEIDAARRQHVERTLLRRRAGAPPVYEC